MTSGLTYLLRLIATIMVIVIGVVAWAAPSRILRMNNREVNIELVRPERLNRIANMAKRFLAIGEVNSKLARHGQMKDFFQKWHQFRDIHFLRVPKGELEVRKDTFVTEMRSEFADLLWSLYRSRMREAGPIVDTDGRSRTFTGELLKLKFMRLPQRSEETRMLTERLFLHWVELMVKTQNKVNLRDSNELNFLKPRSLMNFLAKAEGHEIHDLFVLILKASDIADHYFVSQIRSVAGKESGIARHSDEYLLSLTDAELQALPELKSFGSASVRTLKMSLDQAIHEAQNTGLTPIAMIRMRFESPEIFRMRMSAIPVRVDLKQIEFENEIRRLIDVFHFGDEGLKTVFMEQFLMYMYGVRLGKSPTAGTFRTTGTTGEGKTNFVIAIARALLVYNSTKFSEAEAKKQGLTWYPLEEITEELAKNHTIILSGPEYKDSHSVSKIIGAPPGFLGFDSNSALVSPSNVLAKQIVTAVPVNGRMVKRNFRNFLLDEWHEMHPAVTRLLLQALDGTALRVTESKEMHDVSLKDFFVFLTDNLLQQYLTESDRNIVHRKFSMVELQKWSEAMEDSLSDAEFAAWKTQLAVASMRDFKAPDGTNAYPPQIIARIPNHFGYFPSPSATRQSRVNRYIYNVITLFNNARDGSKGETGIPLLVDPEVIRFIVETAPVENGARGVNDMADKYILRPVALGYSARGSLKMGHVVNVRMAGSGAGRKIEMFSGEPLYLQEARDFNKSAFRIPDHPKVTQPNLSQQPNVALPAPTKVAPKNPSKPDGGSDGAGIKPPTWADNVMGWFGFRPAPAVKQKEESGRAH